MAMLAVSSAYGPHAWFVVRDGRSTLVQERVTYVAPPATQRAAAASAATTRPRDDGSIADRSARASPTPVGIGDTGAGSGARVAPSTLSEVGDAAVAPTPPARETGGAGGALPTVAPRAAVGPIDSRPVGASRAPPQPLPPVQLDSALAVVRGEMAARAHLGPIPIVRDDAARALAPLGATGLSGDGRRALARAVIEDERQRFEAMDRAARGLRPALRAVVRLGGGPRPPPAVSAAEVAAMVERNAARVRRREDSLRLAADSLRIRSDSAARAALTRDPSVRDSTRPEAT